MIGRQLPAEVREFTEPATGRRVRRLTAGAGHSYPLYYFTPSLTPDERYLVLHRHQDGVVNLWRLDLGDGTFTQLTDAPGVPGSWDIWCEPGVRGVQDHRSALNRVTGEVWYFAGQHLAATHIQTLGQRQIAELAGQVCLSQNDFSPDGRYFAMVLTDQAAWQAAVARHSWQAHEAWRQTVSSRVVLVSVATGALTVVAELPFHVHHVLFLDQQTLLLNHRAGGMGFWTMSLDGRQRTDHRPPAAQGETCHQSITANGIWYETINRQGAPRTWLGQYLPERQHWRALPVPQPGYVHVGHDPAGRLACYEVDREPHQLVAVQHPFEAARRTFITIRELPPYPAHLGGQCYHAHPFLGPRRQWLYHTEVVAGVSQVAAVAVADLVAAADAEAVDRDPTPAVDHPR